jgi:hypothetical protein
LPIARFRNFEEVALATGIAWRPAAISGSRRRGIPGLHFAPKNFSSPLYRMNAQPYSDSPTRRRVREHPRVLLCTLGIRDAGNETDTRYPRCFAQLVLGSSCLTSYLACPNYPNCKAPVHLPQRPQRVLGFSTQRSPLGSLPKISSLQLLPISKGLQFGDNGFQPFKPTFVIGSAKCRCPTVLSIWLASESSAISFLTA